MFLISNQQKLLFYVNDVKIKCSFCWNYIPYYGLVQKQFHTQLFKMDIVETFSWTWIMSKALFSYFLMERIHNMALSVSSMLWNLCLAGQHATSILKKVTELIYANRRCRHSYGKAVILFSLIEVIAVKVIRSFASNCETILYLVLSFPWTAVLMPVYKLNLHLLLICELKTICMHWARPKKQHQYIDLLSCCSVCGIILISSSW